MPFFAVIGVAILGLLLVGACTLPGPLFFPLRELANGSTELFGACP